ncbi:energy transducer TonB [Opitutaceae bacterium]|jgi:TonB family protein|nr:energy transducer TonB [Opitutaceae bacterium]
MNKSIKLISSLVLGAALLTSSAFAIPNPGSAQPENENWTAPQPTGVIAPVFARQHEGDTVRVRLVIDELGQPSEIVVLTLVDAELKQNIVTAVEQWQFEPATKDGRAVKTHAVLPIELKIDYNS